MSSNIEVHHAFEIIQKYLNAQTKSEAQIITSSKLENDVDSIRFKMKKLSGITDYCVQV